MNCCCADLKPCPKHKDKPLRIPEIVEHHQFVVRVLRRTSNKKWFHTIARDAIRVFESPDHETKQENINNIKIT